MRQVIDEVAANRLNARTVAVLVLACILFFGVSCQKTTYRKTSVDDYKDSATGALIVKAVPEKNVILKLDGDESTGFRWTADYDRSLVEFVKDEYVLKDGIPADGEFAARRSYVPEEMATHYFSFRMLKSGETLVSFSFARPEDSGPPAKKMLYMLQMQESDPSVNPLGE